MKNFSKFFHLAPGDRLLLLEAWFSLGLARFKLLTVPFRRIAFGLGKRLGPDELTTTADVPSPLAFSVGRAVERAARHTPWNSTCLTQTLAGKSMLQRRGMPSRLYLGTRKDEAGRLIAHSWLVAGKEVLIGGAGHEGFTPLSAFDDRAAQGNPRSALHDVRGS